MNSDGTVTIGITDFAQSQLGDLVFIQLPDVGREYGKGEEAAVIESVKAAGEIKMPLAGTIVEVNTAISNDPATVNQDPQGAGWFFKMTPNDSTELANLMDETAYKHMVG
jgi:glycine cleavage system H protein